MVSPASGTSVCSRTRLGQRDDGLGPAEHLAPCVGRREVDPDPAVVQLGGHDAGDLEERALVVVGHRDRPGEADAVLDDPPGSPAQSVTTRAASAMVNMPWAITSGSPTDCATRWFQWMTLKSPEAPA